MRFHQNIAWLERPLAWLMESNGPFHISLSSSCAVVSLTSRVSCKDSYSVLWFLVLLRLHSLYYWTPLDTLSIFLLFVFCLRWPFFRYRRFSAFRRPSAFVSSVHILDLCCDVATCLFGSAILIRHAILTIIYWLPSNYWPLLLRCSGPLRRSSLKLSEFDSRAVHFSFLFSLWLYFRNSEWRHHHSQREI